MGISWINAAYAVYLRNVEQVGAFYALADARVPVNMRGLFENGDRGVDAARCALEYALKEEPATVGAAGEPILFCGDTTRIMAPITPKEFFHTAGNFGEHHDEAQKVGSSHPVLPWIMFFHCGRHHRPGRTHCLSRASYGGARLRT